MSTSELNSRESETIPRFIVGMSRAGTTWLGKCLNEHPEVAVFGETSFWGRWYVTPNKDGMYDRAQTETIIRRLKKNGTCVQAFAGDRTTGDRTTGIELPGIELPENELPGAGRETSRP